MVEVVVMAVGCGGGGGGDGGWVRGCWWVGGWVWVCLGGLDW